MDEKRYCECGCGGEVKTWKNQRTSGFLRGHHMKCKKSDKSFSATKHYCQCGCGTEIKPLPSGHVNKFIHNHHIKGCKYDLQTRISRFKKTTGKDPIISPYLPETFIRQDKKTKRWHVCIIEDGKSRNSLHAHEVYKHYFGEIPKGYVVHHKNGKYQKISDDRPDNLMLLLDEWNLRVFPVLAKGFNVPEEIITNEYIYIFNKNYDPEIIFLKLCESLINYTKTHENKEKND